MEYKPYPERFDANDSRLSGLVLETMIGINNYMFVGEIAKYEKAIEVLSGLFKKLSIEEWSDFKVLLDLSKYFYWPEETLSGKTIDEFRLHSHLFAMELDNFRNMSEKRQKELTGHLHELHRIVLPYGHKRRDLAA